mmetsp:Transcript_16905/g.22409  ORF Transcript_16905/g.22409 Transcript_16905/m.22409 type:complete len:103 (+) Transcript_16905:2090-2398(+)
MFFLRGVSNFAAILATIPQGWAKIKPGSAQNTIIIFHLLIFNTSFKTHNDKYSHQNGRSYAYSCHLLAHCTEAPITRMPPKMKGCGKKETHVLPLDLNSSFS